MVNKIDSTADMCFRFQIWEVLLKISRQLFSLYLCNTSSSLCHLNIPIIYTLNSLLFVVLYVSVNYSSINTGVNSQTIFVSIKSFLLSTCLTSFILFYIFSFNLFYTLKVIDLFKQRVTYIICFFRRWNSM